MTAGGAPRPSTGWLLGWAVALSLGILVVGFVTGDLGAAPVTVVATELALPERRDAEPETFLSPTFDLDGPTTLGVALERGPEPGFVGASIALVNETTSEVWETRLGTRVTAARSGGLHRRAETLFDRLPTGRYVLRVTPDWEPSVDAIETARPPRATLAARAGARSGLGALIAAALILLPALVVTGRRAFTTRRSGSRRDDDALGAADETTIRGPAAAS